MDLDQLIDRYCSVWCEADPGKRAALLESVWGTDATYTDPTVNELSKSDLLAHIARVQAARPGAEVRRTTVVDEHHGVVRFGFEVLGRDGAVLRHGVDFACLDADRERLKRVIGFFGSLARLQN